MDSTVTFLISIGLCLHWEARTQTGSLPRPFLWADPSPVVHKEADVTLRCQGQPGSDRFQLWMDGELREERNDSWSRADFVLRSVDDWRDARSYRCRSGQGPLWSELSDPLALVVVTEAFPRPRISVSPGSKTSPSTTVTIWCHFPSRPSSENYSFALLEAKSLEPLQLQNNTGKQAAFSLPSVRTEDSGSYSCIYYKKTPPYRGSCPSHALELTVLGPFPKPTLWAQADLVVTPWTNITLWCSRPKLSSLQEVTFTLWKAGTQEPLQQQPTADLWTDFSLSSVSPEDTGSYRCAYRTASGRESERSDDLELVVPGSLPKPSLSALPGQVVEPGQHVTLQCRQPPRSALWRATFTLLKVGSPKPLQSQSPAGISAVFPLLSVRAQDVGNYTCVYYARMAPYQVSEPSDALEIWVTDPSNNIIIILSCVSFLFLLLCLLLFAFLCHGSIPMGPLQGYRHQSCFCCSCLPCSTCRPHHPETPREESPYTEVVVDRPRELQVPMAEEPQGVTYTQLNIRTWNKKKTDSKRTPTEDTLYANLYLD